MISMVFIIIMITIIIIITFFGHLKCSETRWKYRNFYYLLAELLLQDWKREDWISF